MRWLYWCCCFKRRLPPLRLPPLARKPLSAIRTRTAKQAIMGLSACIRRHARARQGRPSVYAVLMGWRDPRLRGVPRDQRSQRLVRLSPEIGSSLVGDAGLSSADVRPACPLLEPHLRCAHVATPGLLEQAPVAGLPRTDPSVRASPGGLGLFSPICARAILSVVFSASRPASVAAAGVAITSSTGEAPRGLSLPCPNAGPAAAASTIVDAVANAKPRFIPSSTITIWNC
jgi:hypothetical protein